MLDLRRYIAGDAALVQPRAALADARALLDEDMLSGRQTPPGKAWTLCQDLDPVACGGLLPIWPGRFMAWSWVGELDASAWRFATHAVRRQLAAAFETGARRIEAQTLADWRPGELWLRRLGFERECVARRFGPDGADYSLWVRLG